MANRTQSKILLTAFAAAIALCGTTRASLTAFAGGTDAPASTLGGYTMSPFTADTVSPTDNLTSSVPTPLGTSLALNPAMSHTTVNDGWGSWSNNYKGDVYFLLNSSTTFATGNVTSKGFLSPLSSPGLPDETITLPANTGAVYLYVEPDAFNANMSVTASDAASNLGLTQLTSFSGGANYFGFYASPGDAITSLTVVSGDPNGYAIGEFGIATTAVPEPASLSMIGLAATGLLTRRARATKN